MAQQIPKSIEFQQNLTSFSMILDHLVLQGPLQFFSSLTSQVISLTNLDLQRICIDLNSLEILTRCPNLKILKFIDCYQERDITIPDSIQIKSPNG